MATTVTPTEQNWIDADQHSCETCGTNDDIATYTCERCGTHVEFCSSCIVKNPPCFRCNYKVKA
jgi:hypothetical protein